MPTPVQHTHQFLDALYRQTNPDDAIGTLFALSVVRRQGKRQSSPAWLLPGQDIIEAVRLGPDSEEFQNFHEWLSGPDLNGSQDVRINLAFRDHGALCERDGRIPAELDAPYFSSALRGSRKECAIVFAFSAEFDFGDVGHAADAATLPPDLDAVREWLEQCRIPDPTIVVKSGHGAHLHWVLEEPQFLFVDGTSLGKANAIKNQFRAFQSKFIDKAPFHIDSTSGIEREWRLPGTYNRKVPDDPKLIEIIEVNDHVYDINQLGPVKERRRNKVAMERSKELIQAAVDGGDEKDILLAKLSQLDANHELFDAMQLLLAGHSFAPRGSRDHTMQRITSYIAWAHRMLVHVIGVEGVTDLLFEPVAKRWAAEPGADKSVEEECEKFAEKLSRALGEKDEDEEDKRAKNQSFENALLANARPTHSPVEEDEMVERADGVKTVPRIVRYRDDFYVYNFGKGTYEPRSYSKGEVVQACRQAWVRDPKSREAIRQALGIKEAKVMEADTRIGLIVMNDKGNVRDATPEELIDRFGVVTTNIRHSLIRERSMYSSEDETLYIVGTPYRPDLEPVRSPIVEEFINLAAGSDAELMRDWLAALLDLENPCAGLYLEGPPRAGKGFFAAGAASLWGHNRRPTEFEKFSGASKFSYIETPLIHLDEGVDDKRGISARIRRLITEQNTHVIEHKGKDPFLLEGTLRLLITANNPDAISETGVSHTQADIDAVIERIAYIKMSSAIVGWVSEVNAWLKSEQKKDGRKQMGFKEIVHSGEFANHCAHLAVHRELEIDRLYCATDQMTPWHLRYLLQGSSGDSDVLQWVARMSTDPVPFYTNRSGKAYANGATQSKVKGGHIILRSQEILDSWKVYMGAVQQPSIKVVNRALEKLCDREGNLYFVRTPFLKLYVEQNQIGDWAQIESNMHT